MKSLQEQIEELSKRIEFIESVLPKKTRPNAPDMDFEAELLEKYFRPGNTRTCKKWTVSDICEVIRIEAGEVLFPNRLGRAIRRLGWERKYFRRNGEIKQGYALSRI